MSYQQKGLNAIRLSKINQPILKARKSQDFPCEFSLEHQTRNSSFKQNRATNYITQHNSRFIIEEEFQKMRRPQTSEGSKRKKVTDLHDSQVCQDSNTKCEILECENEDDIEYYHKKYILYFHQQIKGIENDDYNKQQLQIFVVINRYNITILQIVILAIQYVIIRIRFHFKLLLTKIFQVCLLMID